MGVRLRREGRGTEKAAGQGGSYKGRTPCSGGAAAGRGQEENQPSCWREHSHPHSQAIPPGPDGGKGGAARWCRMKALGNLRGTTALLPGGYSTLGKEALMGRAWAEETVGEFLPS